MPLGFRNLLLSLLAALCLPSCSNSTPGRIATAGRLVAANPDSALVILNHISYNDIKDNEEQTAAFALVRALANNALNRSLLTDTLLPRAVSYYSHRQDTARWVLASRLLAGHRYSTGRTQEAVAGIDSLLEKITAPDLRWDIHINSLELALREQDYATAATDARWLLDHTSKPEDQLRYADALMGTLYLSGRSAEAAALGDSVLTSDFLPARYTPEWGDFINDYAYALQGNGRYAEAVAAMADMMAHTPAAHKMEQTSRLLSMAEFQLNAGNRTEAKRVLASIDETLVKPHPEAYIKMALLKSALEYRDNGVLSADVMQNAPKRAGQAYSLALNDRRTAIENIYALDREKSELTLQRQRLWIIILSLVALSLIIAGGASAAVFRRRQRLVAAEERAETLAAMLRDAERPGVDDKSETVRRLILRQLGILKKFAGAPTAQNQEALRKISETSDGSGLVDWQSLYSMIDELYGGFHSKVVARYPGLFNEKELQIIMLMKAGFSTKEICVLSEQSANTVYVRKSSIRKKLATPPTADFMAILGD